MNRASYFFFSDTCVIMIRMRRIQNVSSIALAGWLSALAITMGFLSLTSDLCSAKQISEYAKGCALRTEGKTEQALKVFQQVLKNNPNHKGALIQTGACLEDLGKWDEAEKVYLNLLRIDPKHISAKRNLDQLKSRLETYKPVSRHKTSKEILLQKGLQALNDKNYRNARKFFRVVQGMWPKDPYPPLYSAIALEWSGQPKQAVEEYKELCERFPKFVPARVNLVLLLLNKGDRVSAKREALAGLEKLPNNKQFSYLAKLAKSKTQSLSHRLTK